MGYALVLLGVVGFSLNAGVSRIVLDAGIDAWTLSDSLFGVTSCEATSHHAHPDAAGDYLFAAVPASPRDPMAEVAGTSRRPTATPDSSIRAT